MTFVIQFKDILLADSGWFVEKKVFKSGLGSRTITRKKMKIDFNLNCEMLIHLLCIHIIFYACFVVSKSTIT